MNIEHKEFISFLKAVQKFQVEYILVGGFSLVFHGYVRGTKDMDIWLRPTNQNRDKLVKAFEELGFAQGIEELKQSDFEKMLRFTAGGHPFEIDMMTYISGVEFDEAIRDAAHFPFEDMNIPVLQLHHLKINKLAAMRPRDLNDIRELEKIQLLKESKLPTVNKESNSFFLRLRSKIKSFFTQ